VTCCVVEIVQEQEGDQEGMVRTLRAALQWWRDSMADARASAEHPKHWLLWVRAASAPAAALDVSSSKIRLHRGACAHLPELLLCTIVRCQFPPMPSVDRLLPCAMRRGC
jgi:hypothetical protein